MKKILSLVLAAGILGGCAGNKAVEETPAPRDIWSIEQAQQWAEKYGWLRGCDFIPSTAINQLEMWQAETFDPETIDRELGMAESIGMNCMRVYLHHLAWQVDPEGFKQRMGQYLDIAQKHGISTIFCILDDCWRPDYAPGKQPEPLPGTHNSGWVRDPGNRYYAADSASVAALTDTLEVYVKDVLNTFRDDDRIAIWDLYNEPGNSGMGERSLPLVEKMFTWGRTVNPSQPLSAGVWSMSLPNLNKYQLENSDIITYHDYHSPEVHQNCIDTLKVYGRPMVCTEYMARTHNSTFKDIMPMLKENNIGAINWGLVAGKTNTIFSWEEKMPDVAEPPVWFHDIFRPDGTVYSQEEVDLIKSLTGVE